MSMCVCACVSRHLSMRAERHFCESFSSFQGLRQVALCVWMRSNCSSWRRWWWWWGWWWCADDDDRLMGFELLMRQVGFYLCNHNAKYWLIYSFDVHEAVGICMKCWANKTVTARWIVRFKSLKRSPHCAGSPLMIYHLIDVTIC